MKGNEFDKAWEEVHHRVKKVKIEDGTVYADNYDIRIFYEDENIYLRLSLKGRAVANIILSKVTGVE